MKLRTLRPIVVAATILAASADVHATEVPIAVGEVSLPAAGSGIDPASLRAVAAAEIDGLDASRIPDRRRVVVSLALTGAQAQGPVACTINAMLRDARTGTMIAIIEAGAKAEGPTSAELRTRVAHAAVRSAIRRIPTALGAK